jgi:hypothetical protein
MKKINWFFLAPIFLLIIFGGLRFAAITHSAGEVNIYYSVGQNTSDHKTGSPTVTISGGVATFSEAQTAANMGVGDKISYGANGVAYISAKQSTTVWNVITRIGGQPAATTTATVSSITHAFSRLADFNAGAKDSSHLNSASLTGSNYILNIPCYYDTATDTKQVLISGWTTSAANYIHIYTPYNTATEVNQTQRHSGVWNPAKYVLAVSSSSVSAIAVTSAAVNIEGLQVYQSNNYRDFYDYSSYLSDVKLSYNIFRGNSAQTFDGMVYIAGYAAGSSLRIWNNIFYNSSGSGEAALQFLNDNASTAYVFNNTFYNVSRGIRVAGTTSFTTYCKNNLISAADAFFGAFVSGDTYNDYNAISENNSGETSIGSHGRYNQTFSFANAASGDFHLASADAGAKDRGITDPGSGLFSDDIDSQTRSGTWDIGADEYMDITPPVITLTGTSTASSITTITWTTDEAATSTVRYGLTSSYDSASSSNSLVTSHSINLHSLSPNTTYHYQVGSADAAGNRATTTDHTFYVSDITPPIITLTGTSTTLTTATITWTTNENSTSTIKYGTTLSYGSASSSNSLVTSHSITLHGLSSNTTYNFQVGSTDSSGNQATSTNHTFRTADNIPPVITLTGTSTSATTATIAWTTDEIATSTIKFGTTSGYGSASSSNSLVTSHSITLHGLGSATLYHFQIGSADAYGNRATSSDHTFTTAAAGTVNAASCSQTDIQAAVNAAQEGYTVAIPACIPPEEGGSDSSGDWSAGQTVNVSDKALTIVGAGIGQTIISPVAAGFSFTGSNDKSFDISNMTIKGNNQIDYVAKIFISRAPLSYFRVHDIHFKNSNPTGDSYEVLTAYPSNNNIEYGLIDHCLVTESGANMHESFVFRGPTTSFINPYWSSTTPENWGSNQAFYVENNTIDFSGKSGGIGGGRPVVDMYQGVRVVFRYNSVIDNYIGGHGAGYSVGNGWERGQSKIEAYGNSFHYTKTTGNINYALYNRSGAGLWFNNNITVDTGVYIDAPMAVASYESIDNSGIGLLCNGSQSWDGNQPLTVDRDGNDGSGTHTGSNGVAVLTDSAKTWTNPGTKFPGITIYNLTDGSHATITAATINTVSGTLVGGTRNNWNTGDVYKITNGYPCLDQIGRGPGQSNEGFYQWNNSWVNHGIEQAIPSENPVTSAHFLVDHANTGTNYSPGIHIQSGKDIFSIPKPNYIPFAFPDPSSVQGLSGRLLGLTGSRIVSGPANISWGAVTGNSKYIIFRDWMVIATTTNTSYYDGGASASNHVYYIQSVNGSGATIAAEGIVATVSSDITPPVITLAGTSTTQTTATITWTTNENATSSVLYGTSISYGLASSSNIFASSSPSHSITLHSLSPNTTYHYQIGSTDASGNRATSSDHSFTTLAVNTYSIGGSISGLTGTVVLQNNGKDNLSRSANGSFTFTTATTTGSSYNVSVFTQPVGQTCTVSSGSGSVTGANVTSVSVTCTTNTYTITASTGANGTVTPIGVTTKNYGDSQAYAIATSTAGYHVADILVDGSSVGTSSLTYTFTNITANHTISATFNINHYTITASAGANGTITPSGITAKNYGTSQAYTIATSTAGYHVANIFVDSVAVGTSSLTYTFTSIHANHTISATFSNGFTPVTYTVGGSISGLTGTVVLQNNGKDNLSRSANGSFTFATATTTGASYAVTVLTNPSGQTCSVSSGSGTVSGANVTSVLISCVNNIVTPPSSGEGGGGIIDTTPPGIPINFVASIFNSRINLSWKNPIDSDFAGVKLYRKFNSALTGQTDTAARLLYQGKNQSFTDASTTPNQLYYYSIYSYDARPNYSLPATIYISISNSSAGHQVATSTVPVNTASSSVPKAITSAPIVASNPTAAVSDETIAAETNTLVSRSVFVDLTPVEKDIYLKTTTILGSVAISQQNKYNIANFIHYGTPSTIVLGSGERGATINSYVAAFNHLPATAADWQDVIRIAKGRWPVAKNANIEAKARAEFKKVYLRQPNIVNAKDDAAVTVIAYGLRPAKRNLNNEKIAIKSFRYVYHRIPTTTFDWNVVRAIAYSGAKR